jgi:zinc protease
MVESKRRMRTRILAAYRNSATPGRGLAFAVAVLVVTVASVTSAAQAPAPAPAPTQAPAEADRVSLAAPIPLDASIRTGTLPNGLTFFIRQNPRPANRVLLRLVVKAGSVDEADDQLGLAHMLEHMAFNGTGRFKPGELVSYLESIGAQFGPHVNAYTSFDETVYMLDVPVDRAGALVRGFEAVSDFAGGMTLDPQEIDRERGVVIEEWRGRLGANTRMQEPQLNGLFGASSQYAKRLPIGTPEILRSFPPDRLRAFYRDHYRADRMAVVAVGDLDPASVEQQIREYFGSLPTRPAAARAVYDIPTHQETRYVFTSDREAQGSSVSLVYKRPVRKLRSLEDYRASLVKSLLQQMVNARLGEMARLPDAPFLGAAVGDQTLGRSVEGFSVGARVNDGDIAKGLTALGQEIARIRQHGFGEAELDRARRATLAGFERAFNERSTVQSGALASELVRHVLVEEAVPGIERELELARQFVASITAAEVAGLARTLVADGNQVVLASAPEKAGLQPATETAMRSALGTGLSASVEPWRDSVTGRELMARPATPGTVRARREIPEIGVTILTLSNGVEAWLKPTDFRNDQIVFTSYARGGLSLAGPDRHLNASLATSLVGLAGVGGISPVDLGKLLAGKIAGAAPYLSTYTHGINGSSTPKDLETALQLASMTFTAPGGDAASLELMKRRLSAALANQDQSPGAAFGERLRRLNVMDHYTAVPVKLPDLTRLDAGAMLGFYRERFANAADFTFFFVGSFTVDEVTPLIATYLGTLPSTGTSTSRSTDLKYQFPPQIVRERVTKGSEPRSQSVITFFSDTGLDELETHRLQAATEVVQMRLRDILREQLGGTYSVGVSYSNTSPEPGYGTTTVQFGSAPENVEGMIAAVMKEVERLRREGPSAADVQAVKEAEKNDLETSLRQNGYWMNVLQSSHILARDPKRIPFRAERTEQLSVQNIHLALQRYLSPDRHTVVTLVPEAQTAPAVTR